MALRLRVISEHRLRMGDKSTFVFGVSGGSIGRSAENDWVLPDDMRYVSGRHARIVFHKGRYLLHKGYQAARLFLAACSLGLAQASLDHSIKYAQERQAFGGSLGRLQLIQEMIADMALEVDTARLATYRAAWGVDQGRDNLKELSMAKYLATEAGTKCADKAIQVHGGWGFMDDCPASRYLRDNRVLENTLTDSLIKVLFDLLSILF